MRAAERLQYLDWRIAALKVELALWSAAHPDADGFDAVCDPDYSLILKRLRPVEQQRYAELGDQEPLSPNRRDHYRVYLELPRWQRKRRRKFVTVLGRCEYPGCEASADECHHRHYRNIGFEENEDLEALCRLHHEARHGFGALA